MGFFDKHALEIAASLITDFQVFSWGVLTDISKN